MIARCTLFLLGAILTVSLSTIVPIAHGFVYLPLARKSIHNLSLARDAKAFRNKHDVSSSSSSSIEDSQKAATPTPSCASRRTFFKSSSATTMGALVAASLLSPGIASAASPKNRSDGYTVQRPDREWAYILSGSQYNILRQGGTERPYASILEGEDQPGTFACAGCSTPLFDASSKFHSGTGWPSFAADLASEPVEVENINPIQAKLAGAEVRCRTCGGHLGDVFQDGLLYVNTPAFKTGKRFCIDGAALVFKPEGGGTDIFGDVPPPKKSATMPSIFDPPKINAL